MAQQLYHIRGRSIDRKDLDVIGSLIASHWDKGRSAISRALCERWNWRQDNGRLKDRACRVLLLKLEEKGEITLPPRLSESYRFRHKDVCKQHGYDNSQLRGTVSEFGSLTIKMVRRTPDVKLWDYLVDTYHYLRHPWIVGSYLKYLAYLDGRLVACLGWGSAAWKVASRDQAIGWNSLQRKANLHKVVNNVRFLILPWINIQHLASKVLAANVRVLQEDWHNFYNQPIALLETFVDTTRFEGTCYKAANWRYIGLTRGRGKYDRHNRQAEPVKAVFLYPLTRDFQEQLCDR